jgi:hypothetical protein
MTSTQPDQRRDLRDYAKLSRLPIQSYVRKATAPLAPREKGPSPARFPAISRFLTGKFAFAYEYLRNRLGARHDFDFYQKRDGDNGVYQMQGEDGEIRIALCGDWGTGTDEAYQVGLRMLESSPHYTVHLGSGPIKVLARGRIG